jgi:23S rRNA (guanine745-N1)-methyltransferase
VSPDVPVPVAAVASRLRCPVCSESLAPAGGRLICRHRHRYDVARQGYITLRAPRGRPTTADERQHGRSTHEVQRAGHFAPLTAALAAEARTALKAGPSVILSRRAARARDRIAAVRGDIWQQIPLTDGSVDLALSVFAPRNGAEPARVLRPGGALVVARPHRSISTSLPGCTRSASTRARPNAFTSSSPRGCARAVSARSLGR